MKNPSGVKLGDLAGHFVLPAFQEKFHPTIPYSQMDSAGKFLGGLEVLRVKTLGAGGFGRVDLVQILGDSSRSFALKTMKKSHIVATKQQKHVRDERRILQELNSDFIVKFYRTFRDKEHVYMLMECCLGGDLWTILDKQRYFDNDTTKFYTACVAQALEYIHSKNIVHRDIKPENLILDDQGYLKLVDFGLAKKLGCDGRTTTFCGTVDYMAPEIILKEGHDLRIDFWSLGVLVFECLSGDLPFTGKNKYETYTNILKGIDTVVFPENLTENATSLIKSLCKEDPSKRLGGLNDIKQHEYFSEFDWEALVARTLAPPVLPQVKNATDSSNFVSSDDDESQTEDWYDITDWDVDF
ncbi:cGMP-dependent protein kinase 1-like [Zophobas morio]|uniref:cGMP-dependent protein kinase 1-like n=1 Tax=Zophobas morio TaxID=2755281 RepID=UPI003083AF0E